MKIIFHKISLCALLLTLAALTTPSIASADSPAVIKNIKTDFGAKCNGIDNDVQAFTNFHEWALNWQKTNTGLIELDIPAGSVCEFITSDGITGITGNNYSGRFFAMGLKKLLVVGYGATLDDANGTGAGYFLGGVGIVQDSHHSARVGTAPAGATNVTLLTPSQTSLFTVGTYAVMTNFDLMGYGFPPNPNYFQFVKVTNINSATGVITFDTPLKDAYKSTYPLYWAGNDFEADQGGPATLYALDPSWDIESEYRGLTFSKAYQLYGGGRSITFTDSKFTNGCPIPSQTGIWTMNNSSCAGNIEVDKIVDVVSFNNSTLGSIDFQSSSINTLLANGLTVLRYLTGTPKKAVISNSTLASFTSGTSGYGKTDEVSCTNCVINDFRAGGVKVGGTDDSVTSNMSINNGIITIPNSAGTNRWAVPGTQAFFSGQYETFFPFTVKDVTQDANNTYVQTTLPGSWPPSPLWYHGLSLNIRVHPAPKFTCINCTNSAGQTLFLGHPPGSPLYSYLQKTFSGSSSGTITPISAIGTQSVPTVTDPIWGKVKSVSINVTKPYTGSQSTAIFHAVSVFDNYPTIKSDGSVYIYGPQINLRQVGNRVITPTGVTCDGLPGACLGDSGLTIPEALWFTQALSVGASTNISSEPSTVWPLVTETIQTDQGLNNNSPTPADTVQPSAPSNLSGIAVSSTNINLSWSPSTDNVGVTGYNIFRNGTKIGTVTTTSFSDTGLIANNTYSYSISAYDAAGNTSALSGVTVSTPTVVVPVTNKFITGDRVKTVGKINIRTTASASGKPAGQQKTGAPGTVITGPTANGGYQWYNVNFDSGTDGWVTDASLSKILAMSSSSFIAQVGVGFEELLGELSKFRFLLQAAFDAY